jgi:hypothetical protein
MLRRLLLNGLLSTLLLCGWSGAFAAVLCPHAQAARAASVAGAHDCCRARAMKKAAPPTAQCHKQREMAKGAHAAHEARSVRGAHGHQAQASLKLAHAAQASREAAQRTRREQSDDGPVLEKERMAWAARAALDCTHCMGRPEPPNAPAETRGSEGSRRELIRPEPRAQRMAAFSFELFVSAVIPMQGAPPGAARRHVLLNVFLI